MTTRRVTITTLAAEFNIARSEALRYLTEAKVLRAPDKTYPYRAAAAAIRSRKDLAKVLGHRTAGRAGGKLHTVDVAPIEADEIDPLDTSPTPAAAPTTVAASAIDDLRAGRVQAQAGLDQERMRRLRLQNDASEGRLIDREAVEKTATAIVRKTRAALLSLGVRVAPLVIGLEDANEAARVIDGEVRKVLGALADEAEFTAEVLS